MKFRHGDRRPRRLLVTLALTTTLLAACDNLPPDPAPASGRALTRAEELRLSDAEQRLVGRCMNRQGFSYREWHPLSLEESRATGFVQDDVGWAREHGYGSAIEAKARWAREHNPNGAYRRSLSAERRRAYDEALDGGPDARVLAVEVPGGTVRRRAGGCAVEAQRQLYSDLPTWFRADKIAGNLRPLYVPRVMRDERFRTALRLWSACMRREGHRYAHPGEAREAARGAAQGLSGTAFEKAFRDERGIAVADATCARETSLKRVGKARETHYQGQLDAEYGDGLATYQRLRGQALARAVKIVGPRT